MRNLLSLLGAALLCGALGCESTPSAGGSAPASIDYGARPDNHEQIVKEYFAKTLPDPGSAEYRMSQPFAGYIKAGPLMGGKVQEAGYFVEVWLKAKDRAGAMLPERRLGLLVKNGEVLMQMTAAELDAVVRARTP